MDLSSLIKKQSQKWKNIEIGELNILGKKVNISWALRPMPDTANFYKAI